jgi:hypothetical protein
MKIAGFKSISSFSIAGTVVALALVGTMSIAVAQGTPEQQQACTGDAQRLCGAYIPDVQRITACLERAKRQLSPACRAVFSTPYHRRTHRTRRRT